MFLDLHTIVPKQQAEQDAQPSAKKIARQLATVLPGCRITVATVDGAPVGFFEREPTLFTPEERNSWLKRVAGQGTVVRQFNDKQASEEMLNDLLLTRTLACREASFKGFEHLTPAFMAAFAKARPNLSLMDLRKTKGTSLLIDAFLKSLQEDHALMKKRMSEPERSEEERGIVFRVGGSDLTPAQKKELHLRYPFATLEDPEETILDLSRPEELSSESSLTFKQIALKAKHLPKLQSIDLSGYKGCFCLFSLLALEKERSIQIHCEAPAELIVPASIDLDGESRAPNRKEIRDVLRRFYKEPVTADLRQVASLSPLDLLYLEEEFQEWKWIAPPLKSCTLSLVDIGVIEPLCKRFPEIQIELTRTSLAQEKELFGLLDLFPDVQFSNKERVTHLLEDGDLLKSYLKRSLLKNLRTNLSDEELANLADRSQPLKPLLSKIQAFRTGASSSSIVSITREIDALDFKPNVVALFQPPPQLSPAPNVKFGSADTTASSGTFFFGSSTAPSKEDKGAEKKTPAALATESPNPLNHPFGFSSPPTPWHSPSTPSGFVFPIGKPLAFGQVNRSAPAFGFAPSAFSNSIHSFGPSPAPHSRAAAFNPTAAAKEKEGIPPPSKEIPTAVNDALLNATLKGDVGEVERLLAQGADINALGKYGERPLLLAALKGIEPLIKLLVEKGADVKVVDLQGNSPLHLAAENGLTKSVELLIRKGADVFAKNIRGNLPIEMAAEAEQRQMKGTFQTPNRDYLGVLYQLNFCFIIIPFLKEFAGRNRDTVENYTTMLLQSSSLKERYLNQAIECGHPEVVKLLLANGAKSKKHNSSDQPFLNAVSKGNQEIVRLLLNSGEKRSPSDLVRPLFTAVEMGSLEIVKLLLMHGAAVNEKLSGKFALLAAVEKGHQEIAELLIATGADINAQSDGAINPYFNTQNRGDTALHAAVRQGNLALVKILIEKGASVNASSSYGAMPLDLAIGKNFDEIAALLIEKGANVHPPKETAQPFFGFSRSGIQNGPLHFTAANGNLRLVELLIAKGADVNAKGLHGNVPLHFAAENGRVEVVKFLLAKGANRQLHNDRRQLPIHISKSPEVIELLSKTN